MFKWFRKRRVGGFKDVTAKAIRSCEDPNTVYVEFPDGLRLIIRDGKYDGHYVA